MNNKQKLVVNGLLGLTPEEADAAIREYRNIRDDTERTVKFSEEIKMQTGPFAAAGASCICCGR